MTYFDLSPEQSENWYKESILYVSPATGRLLLKVAVDEFPENMELYLVEGFITEDILKLNKIS